MGGFTSAPPILAARIAGAQTFLHESNVIPGRANRWLSWVVEQAFIGFPSAAGRLKHCRVTVLGTPVRSGFKPRDAASDRVALGLDPARPVVLVVGGSQGASGVNRMVAQSLPLVAKLAPDWQWLHLSGPRDASGLQGTYDSLQLRAVVVPFFDRMELALGAASAAISRAGAASLAELAAVRLPSLLVPYPSAADNHQWHNARAYETAGAAKIMEQHAATPESLVKSLRELIENQTLRETMQASLARWERPQAASQIAAHILDAIAVAEAHKPARAAIGPLPAARSQSVNPAVAAAAPFLSQPIVRDSRQTGNAVL
jgi:UDP-N-acetylglucosamine--N-acetylmuramyl-(pentapeptide) pyrophosphoryl-undecaprenol N-acetylglucosamine transferase